VCTCAFGKATAQFSSLVFFSPSWFLSVFPFHTLFSQLSFDCDFFVGASFAPFSLVKLIGFARLNCWQGNAAKLCMRVRTNFRVFILTAQCEHTCDVRVRTWLEKYARLNSGNRFIHSSKSFIQAIIYDSSCASLDPVMKVERAQGQVAIAIWWRRNVPHDKLIKPAGYELSCWEFSAFKGLLEINVCSFAFDGAICFSTFLFHFFLSGVFFFFVRTKDLVRWQRTLCNFIGPQLP